MFQVDHDFRYPALLQVSWNTNMQIHRLLILVFSVQEAPPVFNPSCSLLTQVWRVYVLNPKCNVSRHECVRLQTEWASHCEDMISGLPFSAVFTERKWFFWLFLLFLYFSLSKSKCDETITVDQEQKYNVATSMWFTLEDDFDCDTRMSTSDCGIMGINVKMKTFRLI